MIASVEWIDAEDAKALIETEGAVIIDVRELGEIRASGMVPGAINIPLAAFLARIDPASPEREPALTGDASHPLLRLRQALSICRSKLVEFGYRKVFNLGGLNDWMRAGLPVDAATE